MTVRELRTLPRPAPKILGALRFRIAMAALALSVSLVGALFVLVGAASRSQNDMRFGVVVAAAALLVAGAIGRSRHPRAARFSLGLVAAVAVAMVMFWLWPPGI